MKMASGLVSPQLLDRKVQKDQEDRRESKVRPAYRAYRDQLVPKENRVQQEHRVFKDPQDRKVSRVLKVKLDLAGFKAIKDQKATRVFMLVRRSPRTHWFGLSRLMIPALLLMLY
jgi:hypothetical protein